MDEARFSKRAKPGDEIHLELEMTRLRAPLIVFNGRVTVTGQLLARVEGLTLAFGDLDAVTAPADVSQVVPATTASIASSPNVEASTPAVASF